MTYIEGASTLKKSYLMAIIDDHSRLIIYACFYPSETFETLKDALRYAISRRGIPQKFYSDNGSCYRSDQLERILASLGIALTHSRPYRPQVRGKIERWFKNIRDSFLPMLDPAPLPLAELNDKLDAFVEEYNNSEHSSINETPYQRYRHDLSCVRPAPERIMDYFRRREYRRVKKDRTVQINNRCFEVPASLIDKTVELFFHDDAPDDVEIMHQNITYGRAVVLDQAVNSRIGRDWGKDQRSPRDKEKHGIAAPVPSGVKEVHGGYLFDRVACNPEEATHL